MSALKVTRIDNFVCPACGEVIRQVAATDGVVEGYCPHAKKKIRVVIDEVVTAPPKKEEPKEVKELSYLDSLKEKREKVLKEVVSAREDGDLKENAGYHAAREQLSIIDGKILQEEERIKRESV